MSKIFFPDKFGGIYLTIYDGQRINLRLSESSEKLMLDFSHPDITSVLNMAYEKQNDDLVVDTPKMKMFSVSKSFLTALHKHFGDRSHRGVKIQMATANGGMVALSDTFKNSAATCLEKNALLTYFFSTKLNLQSSLFVGRIYKKQKTPHAWSYLYFHSKHWFIDAYCTVQTPEGELPAIYEVGKEDIKQMIIKPQRKEAIWFKLIDFYLNIRQNCLLGFAH